LPTRSASATAWETWSRRAPNDQRLSRDEEASRYWAESEAVINANGLATSIYDCCTSDSSDNVGTAARWAREMNATTVNANRWQRVYLEFHSNAGGGREP